MNPKFKLTPSQIKAIKDSAKGVLPAFLGPVGKAKTMPGTIGKSVARGTTMPGAVGGAAGRAKPMPGAIGGAIGRALGKKR